MLQKYMKNNINKNYLKIYFIKRFSRIYVVLIPALIIGFCFDYFGKNLFIELYTQSHTLQAVNFNVVENMNFENFIGNILNLQTIFFNHFGSNSPLWSLSNEWWYYMLFPLFFLGTKNRILLFALILVLFIFNIDILIYSIIWLLGAFVFQIKKKMVHIRISVFLFILVLLISRLKPGLYIDLAIACSLGFLINSIKYSEFSFNLFESLNSKMADFSYSLYLFHFPIMAFLVSVVHSFYIEMSPMQFDLTSLSIFLVVLTFSYVLSYLMYVLFERNTNKIKNYLIIKFITKENND